MKENWGQPGMPPLYVEVLSREILSDSPGYRSEVVYIAGDHKHLGKYHKGWTGHETIVKRQIIKGEVRLKK